MGLLLSKREKKYSLTQIQEAYRELIKREYNNWNGGRIRL